MNIRVGLIFALLHLINSKLLMIFVKKKDFRALVVYREKRENLVHAKKRSFTVLILLLSWHLYPITSKIPSIWTWYLLYNKYFTTHISQEWTGSRWTEREPRLARLQATFKSGDFIRKWMPLCQPNSDNTAYPTGIQPGTFLLRYEPENEQQTRKKWIGHWHNKTIE